MEPAQLRSDLYTLEYDRLEPCCRTEQDNVSPGTACVDSTALSIPHHGLQSQERLRETDVNLNGQI